MCLDYAYRSDLIIIQARLYVNGKTARKIVEVAEVAGMEGDKPRLNVIWKYNAASDQIEETGIPSKLRETIYCSRCHSRCL